MMIQRKIAGFLLGVTIVLIVAEPIASYPVDGYAESAIRRIERLRLVIADSLRGTKPPAGGLKSISEIKLNLLGSRGDSLATLPLVDARLQKEIDALFPNRHESYSLALLEITPGKSIRLAERQSDRQFSPGSVGKLCIAAGLFTELQRIFPADPEKRRNLLKTRMITGGKWIQTDTHEIPVYNLQTRQFQSRAAREDDVFSLYEWVDHMLSASSNAAASVVWKEVVLLRQFGTSYPPSPEAEKEYFEKTAKAELGRIASEVVNEPLRAIGISEEQWRLGSFFTGYGKRAIPAAGGSTATPQGYLKFLVAIERGLLVDSWSSLEIKRLMYMTARRIRYAASPELVNAAVYFKSGSLYRCTPEADFTCAKYQGNVENVMNSVVIVEHPAGRTYLVSLMSNILRKNSAVEHQSLATFIDRILAKRD